MRYPVFVFMTKSGTYDGYFVDAIGCFFAGDTFDEALRDAELSFKQYMEVLAEDGGHTPAPSDEAACIDDPRLAQDNGVLAFVEIVHQA
ncbi:hypothetical protein CYR55_22590 [Chimaeribacter californicus]|uniref:HicB-like antitoxin of toxin-antitoxin system domain-containing protein n=1 Tax=Chimaeribacter californicus TaxID=2060067 RepID=A0A2N5DTJ9_9GAMM|nr:type II toxin-antitoxin system HicB family antitoxin [Chimaeribacter californicus]PLR29844.1 hypothetical protein CYR55_22590 [Chimaeribacter californicus]